MPEARGVRGFVPPQANSDRESPVTADPAENPAGTADATMVADAAISAKAAAVDVPPEIVAQSLGQYLRKEIKAGKNL